MEPVCHIDEFGPLPVVGPTDVAALSEVVRQAAAGTAVYPLGGRTQLDLGLPPSKPGVAIDLTELDHVIDYAARDMTITVQAGITVGKLQTILSDENQQLPVDVPRPDLATLGGALATNASGPRRYGYGTLRDYVIGISVVNDEGQEVKAGGRVVKNVAGYDLMKLYVGSLGTLGIITQVTLKVKPRPGARALLGVPCPEGRLDALLDLVHSSRTRPTAVTLVHPRAVAEIVGSDPAATLAAEGNWLVLVGFEDSAAAVEWQVLQLRREVGAVGTTVPLSDAAWTTLAD